MFGIYELFQSILGLTDNIDNVVVNDEIKCDKLVSVIIPAYNEENNILNCVQSVLAN